MRARSPSTSRGPLASLSLTPVTSVRATLVRSPLFLRRAFGGFSAREKRQIAENLAEHWGMSADAASEALLAIGCDCAATPIAS